MNSFKEQNRINMENNNLAKLSAFPHPTDTWSRKAELASSLWFALDTAQRFISLQRWGIERVSELEFKTLRNQQKASFIGGLSKLGLDKEPDHIASAKYHALSNQ